jgi:hypothetical protein
LGFCIGENQTQKKKSEGAALQQRQGESEMRIADDKQQPGEQLNHEVAWRNASLAMAAAAAQNEPAQHRDIVIEADRSLAVRAGRPGMNDRNPPWQPIDTHIQEAAEGQPQSENRQCQSRVHCGLVLTCAAK